MGSQPWPWVQIAAAWLAWVIFLNGGTLAFNSAYDKDVKDIAYLRRPPQPPRRLFAFAFTLMLAGTVVATWVSFPFGLLTAGCLVLSILYSHPRTRWKGIAGLDLAVNMFGYGAGTTLAGLLIGAAAFGTAGSGLAGPAGAGWWLTAGFALLFGSFYPLTQLYQLQEDNRRGDRTLASALGIRPSLAMAFSLGVLASVFLLGAASRWNQQGTTLSLLPPAAILAAWLGFIAAWHLRAPSLTPRDHERRMYQALALWAAVDLSVLFSRYTSALVALGKSWFA
jgi:4-hydroxybenzoate polyprenyltransferase